MFRRRRPRRQNGASTSTDASTTTTTAPVPGAEWETVAPASVGLDPAALEQIAATAETGKSNCLVVVRDAKIAGEWYFKGTNAETTQNVFSITKSVSSTLVGIAQDEGDLDIGDPASTWITEWKGTPSEGVTVQNLLSNDSGREWSLAIDYVQLIQAHDRTAFAIGLSQTAPPGTIWAYNNSAIQTLQRVVQQATAEPVVEFAQERLFAPIGMTHSLMTTDPAGNAQMFQGVRTNCRDMARFGVLMLNHGKWGDDQIVSADWVAGGDRPIVEGAQRGLRLPVVAQPGGNIGESARRDSAGAADAGTRQGQIVPDAPDDMFWALGLGNQIVQVDPGSRTVVVRLGTIEPRPQPPTFGPTEASRSSPARSPHDERWGVRGTATQPALAARRLPHEWHALISTNVVHWRVLGDGQRELLEEYALRLVTEKRWEAARGFTLTEEMHLTIAAQAALLVLGIGHEAYRGVGTIIVHPTTMHAHRASGAGRSPATRHRRARSRCSASRTTTVRSIIAWDAARAGARHPERGHNVVYHEFAHKIDMLDGTVDGTPPLETRRARRRWVEVCTAEFEALRAGTDDGFLDGYAATNPGEFFAVVTEVVLRRADPIRGRQTGALRRASRLLPPGPGGRGAALLRVRRCRAWQ